MPMRWTEAKEVLDPDLYEALETIMHLRATLQLAYFTRDELDVNEVDNELNAAAKVLAKHDVSDDMMDSDNPPEDDFDPANP